MKPVSYTHLIHHFVTTDKEREDFQTKWEVIDHNKHRTGEIRYRYLGDDYITYYSNLENTDWSIRVTENYSSQKESIQSFRIYYLLAVSYTHLWSTSY